MSIQPGRYGASLGSAQTQIETFGITQQAAWSGSTAHGHSTLRPLVPLPAQRQVSVLGRPGLVVAPQLPLPIRLPRLIQVEHHRLIPAVRPDPLGLLRLQPVWVILPDRAHTVPVTRSHV